MRINVDVVGFYSKSVYVCGRPRAGLEKKGRPLSISDLEIAAIAMAGDFALITGNTRHFQRIDDLRLENRL
jgi:tRNA(fMet)-specific endonuclease VapC